MSDKLLTISLKGSSQSQPWAVVNADSRDEALEAFEALGLEFSEDATLFQIIADANAQFQAVLNVANPSGRASAPAAGAGEPAQETQAATPAPARQRGGNSGGSAYGRKKAVAGTGGRGGKKPKLTYEEASADCAHGERRRFTKPDVDWVLYGCPLDKNDPNNCGAQFIDKVDDGEEG